MVPTRRTVTTGNSHLRPTSKNALVALANKTARVAWALLAMLVVIVAYDQLLFRPIVAWADKFRLDQTAGQDSPRSWLLEWMRRTRAVAIRLEGLDGRWRATALRVL